MKKVILYSLLFVSGYCGMVRPEFTYVDITKLASRIYSGYEMRHDAPGSAKKVFGTDASPGLQVDGLDIIVLSQLLAWGPIRSLSIGKKPVDNCMIDVMKHHIWYGRDLKERSANTTDVASIIREPIMFAVINFTLDVAANELNKFDSVKNITQNLREQNRTFIYRNGKLVASAAVARFDRISCEEGMSGMNYDNLIKFGTDATVQVGSQWIEEYGIKSIANYVTGEEDSLRKDAVSAVLSLMTYATIG